MILKKVDLRTGATDYVDEAELINSARRSVAWQTMLALFVVLRDAGMEMPPATAEEFRRDMPNMLLATRRRMPPHPLFADGDAEVALKACVEEVCTAVKNDRIEMQDVIQLAVRHAYAEMAVEYEMPQQQGVA